MNWISMKDSLPTNVGYYFVWLPAWSAVGSVAHGDIGFWDGEGWNYSYFPSLAEGASVSHWAAIEPPHLTHTVKKKTARPTLQKMVCADTAKLLGYSVNELLEIGWRVIQIGEFGKQAWALLERTPASPLAGEGLE